MYRKIYFTIEMQPIILNTFLVTYEFTGCNLRVGIRRVLETLYRVRTLEGLADSPLICSQDFGPFAENGFRAFHRAEMSSEDTQHRLNKLHFSSKNQIE